MGEGGGRGSEWSEEERMKERQKRWGRTGRRESRGIGERERVESEGDGLRRGGGRLMSVNEAKRKIFSSSWKKKGKKKQREKEGVYRPELPLLVFSRKNDVRREQRMSPSEDSPDDGDSVLVKERRSRGCEVVVEIPGRQRRCRKKRWGEGSARRSFRFRSLKSTRKER